ncbi:MAG: flagellar hook-length control protein FliK [Pseudomonadota bacterium]
MQLPVPTPTGAVFAVAPAKDGKLADPAPDTRQIGNGGAFQAVLTNLSVAPGVGQQSADLGGSGNAPEGQFADLASLQDRSFAAFNGPVLDYAAEVPLGAGEIAFPASPVSALAENSALSAAGQRAGTVPIQNRPVGLVDPGTRHVGIGGDVPPSASSEAPSFPNFLSTEAGPRSPGQGSMPDVAQLGVSAAVRPQTGAPHQSSPHPISTPNPSIEDAASSSVPVTHPARADDGAAEHQGGPPSGTKLDETTRAQSAQAQDLIGALRGSDPDQASSQTQDTPAVERTDRATPNDAAAWPSHGQSDKRLDPLIRVATPAPAAQPFEQNGAPDKHTARPSAGQTVQPTGAPASRADGSRFDGPRSANPGSTTDIGVRRSLPDFQFSTTPSGSGSDTRLPAAQAQTTHLQAAHSGQTPPLAPPISQYSNSGGETPQTNAATVKRDTPGLATQSLAVSAAEASTARAGLEPGIASAATSQTLRPDAGEPPAVRSQTTFAASRVPAEPKVGDSTPLRAVPESHQFPRDQVAIQTAGSGETTLQPQQGTAVTDAAGSAPRPTVVEEPVTSFASLDTPQLAAIGERTGPDAPLRSDPQRVAAADIPRPAAHQIAGVLHAAPGTLDVTLTPEELGRVSLTLNTQDGVLTVQVSAERPETLDLLRRHVDLLTQEAHAAGFEDVAFGFSDRGGSGDAAHRHASGEPAKSDRSRDVAVPAQTPQVYRSRADVSGLDLRL